MKAGWIDEKNWTFHLKSLLQFLVTDHNHLKPTPESYTAIIFPAVIEMYLP